MGQFRKWHTPPRQDHLDLLHYICSWGIHPMRVIEQKMNAAIRDSKDWHLTNTMVTNHDGVSFVFLHGNLIAEIGDTWLKLFDGGWQSNTTKSRLNAILREHGAPGEHIFQKKWEWFITLNTPSGLQTVPFRSSMRLAWFGSIHNALYSHFCWIFKFQ